MGLKQTAKSWRSCPKSDVVENYIGRAEDFVPVSTKQLVDDYRLDYPGTNYTDMDKGYGVIKFKNTEPSKVDYAIGSKGDAPPNTKSGMLGNDSRVIMEYKMEPRGLQKGDILEIYDASGGKPKSIYNYNEQKGGWVKQ